MVGLPRVSTSRSKTPTDSVWKNAKKRRTGEFYASLRYNFLFRQRKSRKKSAHTRISPVYLFLSNGPPVKKMKKTKPKSQNQLPGTRYGVPLEAKGFPSGYPKSVCVYPHALRKLRTYRFFPQMMSDEHSPTPPPSRWPAFITLHHLTKFQLVWRRLCDVVLFLSCLFEHTLTAVCVVHEY